MTPPSHKQKILLVDDESDIADVMAKGLRIAGFEVETKNNPLEALANFNVGTYGMALLDIKMPHMDGFDLYEKLSEKDRKMKVCFLTAFDVDYFENFKQRFPHIPTHCFIKKPVTIKTLVEMVNAELRS